jgi:hypothetical protein
MAMMCIASPSWPVVAGTLFAVGAVGRLLSGSGSGWIGTACVLVVW